MDVWLLYVVWALRPFAINFIIVPGILIGSSFIISVCMFIVSKPLLISSATVIIHAGGGGIWLNSFATMLFSVRSTVTVEQWSPDYRFGPWD